MTVTQKDYDIDVTHKQYYIEQYAKNVGLIYKMVIDVYSKQTEWPTSYPINYKLPIMQRISSGVVEYKLTVIAYGG